MPFASMQIMFNFAMQDSQCSMISGESFFLWVYFTSLFLHTVSTVSKYVLTSLWAELIDDNHNDIFFNSNI